jgi:hypothetical protein
MDLFCFPFTVGGSGIKQFCGDDDRGRLHARINDATMYEFHILIHFGRPNMSTESMMDVIVDLELFF